MTWASYIDGLKQQKGVADAAIFTTEGVVCATTDIFKDITPDQIKAVSAGPGNGSTVTLAGVKAMVLKTEKTDGAKLMTLVTMKNTTMSESSPLVIGISDTVLVIGLGLPGYRSVGISVETITKHLKKSGY